MLSVHIVNELCGTLTRGAPRRGVDDDVTSRDDSPVAGQALNCLVDLVPAESRLHERTRTANGRVAGDGGGDEQGRIDKCLCDARQPLLTAGCAKRSSRGVGIENDGPSERLLFGPVTNREVVAGKQVHRRLEPQLRELPFTGRQLFPRSERNVSWDISATVVHTHPYFILQGSVGSGGNLDDHIEAITRSPHLR